MVDALTPQPRKGRGAIGNPQNRYERTHKVAVSDGWHMGEADQSRLRTELIADDAKSIIAKNTSPDVGFTQSINPYRGCEHGCVYCFARPNYAHLGFSPGLDFESKIFYKPRAPQLLEQTLAKPSYECSPIALGMNTDAYQPVERKLEITRRILEVLSAHDHPVTIVTKSDLVLRDLDILEPMAEKNLVRVMLSVTTLDRHLANKMEPRAATPVKRLNAVRDLSAAGIPAGIMVAPVIPALTDPEMEAILEAASEAGAEAADYVLLRLPHELKEMYEDWLRVHYPRKADRVLNLMRQMRMGELYKSAFGTRMKGTGPYAEILAKRFEVASRRLRLNGMSADLNTELFRTKAKPGRQLAMF